jgi:hypothetical protein
MQRCGYAEHTRNREAGQSRRHDWVGVALTLLPSRRQCYISLVTIHGVKSTFGGAITHERAHETRNRTLRDILIFGKSISEAILEDSPRRARAVPRSKRKKVPLPNRVLKTPNGRRDIDGRAGDRHDVRPKRNVSRLRSKNHWVDVVCASGCHRVLADRYDTPA